MGFAQGAKLAPLQPLVDAFAMECMAARQAADDLPSDDLAQAYGAADIFDVGTAARWRRHIGMGSNALQLRRRQARLIVLDGCHLRLAHGGNHLQALEALINVEEPLGELRLALRHAPHERSVLTLTPRLRSYR